MIIGMLFPSGEVRSQTEQVDAGGADVDQEKTFRLRRLQQLDLCGRWQGRCDWIVIRRAVQSTHQHMEPNCSYELQEEWSKLISSKSFHPNHFIQKVTPPWIVLEFLNFCSEKNIKDPRWYFSYFWLNWTNDDRSVWQWSMDSCTLLAVSMARRT